MTGIPVALEIARGDDDLLVPSLDSSTGLLTWKSSSGDPWARGFDVDALVIFDCSEVGLVRNIELLVPKARWSRSANRSVGFPSGKPNRVIRIARSVFEDKSLRVPVRVQLEDDVVSVEFTDQSAQCETAYPVSSSAWVSVAGDLLVRMHGRLGAGMLRQ